MKKVYTGLEAIKVSLEGADLLTGSQNCWQYVANQVVGQLQCTTDDPGKIGEWVDYSDPGYPATAPGYC